MTGGGLREETRWSVWTRGMTESLLGQIVAKRFIAPGVSEGEVRHVVCLRSNAVASDLDNLVTTTYRDLNQGSRVYWGRLDREDRPDGTTTIRTGEGSVAWPLETAVGVRQRGQTIHWCTIRLDHPSKGLAHSNSATFGRWRRK